MSTKPVTYRLEESLLQRIEQAVEVLQKGNQYGSISKNSVVAGILEKGVGEILNNKEESPVKKLDIYNGESKDITVVTDHDTVVIPAGCSRTIQVDSDAQFNQPEFYVQEPGNWYIKTEHCHSLCDAEIYDAG